MPEPKLSALELKIMNELWSRGACSIREVHEAIAKRDKPAYTTVQTMIYRLEEKKAVRRVKKIGNAHVFEAVVTRKAVHRKLIDDLLDLFGGSAAPVMAHLVDSGKLSLADVRAAEQALHKQEKKS